MTTPDNIKPINQAPKVVCTPTAPPTKTPGTDTGTLPEKEILLQEEMNRTMVCLLTTRLFLDACRRKWVSDFEIALHQNEAEATQAIREAKTHCGTTIREAEASCATYIREAEAYCATTITKAEALCAAEIRKAESCCADHAHSIQQLHAADMQCLEMEAMEEEGEVASSS